MHFSLCTLKVFTLLRYPAAISGSLTYSYARLILKYKYCSYSKLEYNLGYKKLANPVYQIVWFCAEIPTNLGIYLLDVLYKKDK